VFVIPPPVPLIVIEYVPVEALLDTVHLRVDFPEPGAEMEPGLKLAVTPDGIPVADNAIGESNPPETVVDTVALPLEPWFTDWEVGDTEMVKLGVSAALTVSETVVVSMVVPAVPLTVMVYEPATVVEATARVIEEVPAPEIEEGLKVTVTPAGAPDAVKATAVLNPPVTVLVMVELPELPCTTVTELGEAVRLKPGVAEADPASAFMRLTPFGLPQPVARSYPVVAESPLLPLTMSWKSES
jgi:hypothetical protein